MRIYRNSSISIPNGPILNNQTNNNFEVKRSSLSNNQNIANVNGKENELSRNKSRLNDALIKSIKKSVSKTASK